MTSTELPAALEYLLRAELRRLVTRAGTTRALAPVCLVGHPAGEQAAIAGSDARDAGHRAELVVRALDGLESTDRACAWLTRSGDLEALTDADVEWYAAARTGFARHDVPLEHFLVLNRTGWVDLVTGSRRSWSRVRPLPRRTPPGWLEQ